MYCDKCSVVTFSTRPPPPRSPSTGWSCEPPRFGKRLRPNSRTQVSLGVVLRVRDPIVQLAFLPLPRGGIGHPAPARRGVRVAHRLVAGFVTATARSGVDHRHALARSGGGFADERGTRRPPTGEIAPASRNPVCSHAARGHREGGRRHSLRGGSRFPRRRFLFGKRRWMIGELRELRLYRSGRGSPSTGWSCEPPRLVFFHK